MNKFNRKLSFDASHQLETNPNPELDERRRRISLARLERRTSRDGQANNTLDPRLANTEEFSCSFLGLAGVFIPIQNDFTHNGAGPGGALASGPDVPGQQPGANQQPYRDAAHWPRQKREQVKRVRFFICVLALLALALGLMSRLILNVSIVEMVRKEQEPTPGDELVPAGELVSEKEGVLAEGPTPASTHHQIEDDPILFAAQQESQPPSDSSISAPQDSTEVVPPSNLEPPPDGSNEQRASETEGSATDEDAGLKFDWSKQDVNLILGAFYVGYMPGILLGGDLSQRFGAKYPLLIGILGSALINGLTPLVARFSVMALIGLRVLLGLIQGALMPALYELFNRWLTPTESSIFAPMIKVSMPLGSLMGTLMPALLTHLKLAWPNLFYIGCALCFVWSIMWLCLATSMPHTNRFVGQRELDRIMRKKSAAFKIIEIPASKPAVKPEGGDRLRRRSSSSAPQVIEMKKLNKQQPQQEAVARRPTPWLQIITNPSVLALALVKLTYNMGSDFIFLQLAVYLREVHKAPITTISYIASGAFLMQMLLISFVGWLAKVVVLKRTFGLSVTKWRKLFQGGSNIFMAASYFTLAFLDPGIELATSLVLAVAFFWMLGAGGESLVPYDLSKKFPASIVGFTHSISISSGIALTALINVVVGENTTDSWRWSLLFYIIASLLSSTGIVFILVLKAKPFLPGERQADASHSVDDKAPPALSAANLSNQTKHEPSRTQQQSRSVAKEREADSQRPNGMR